jgi:hypothetical protein
MISAEEELKIFQNILAESPKGLDDPELIGKFSKAKAFLHRMDSMEAMQSQMMPQNSPMLPPTDQNAPTTSNEPLGGAISPQSTNTPQNANEGGNVLKLP